MFINRLCPSSSCSKMPDSELPFSTTTLTERDRSGVSGACSGFGCLELEVGAVFTAGGASGLGLLAKFLPGWLTGMIAVVRGAVCGEAGSSSNAFLASTSFDG